MGKKKGHYSIRRDSNALTDPTRNVLDKIDSSIHRVDCLREAETRRTNDLRDAESRRVSEQFVLSQEHNKELRYLGSRHLRELRDAEKQLREAESKRIDANRAGDVFGVGIASERVNQQTSALAREVAATAEANRTTVAAATAEANRTTAATVTQMNDRTALMEKTLSERITILERQLSEERGKSRVADPAMDRLVQSVRDLAEINSTRSGGSVGMREMWGWVMGGVGILIALSAVAVNFLRP